MQKIKARITTWVGSEKGRNILTSIIIILVGFASYGAGRLSKSSEKSGIKIEYVTPPVPVVQASTGAVKGAQASTTTQSVTPSNRLPVSNVKTYFASSRGNKYYHLGCDGGKTLKEENKVYFNSAAEAEAAGYELSTSCR